MTIIDHYIDPAGKHRYIIEIAGGATLTLKFQAEATTAQLEAAEAAHIEAMEYRDVEKVTIEVTDNIELIKGIVIRLKNTPNLTATQYNNYLSTLAWFDQVTIRYFIYRFALMLAERYGVELTDYTEAQALRKVRDWIVATPLRKIAKILFGNLLTIE
jgi:hypothetical protein